MEDIKLKLEAKFGKDILSIADPRPARIFLRLKLSRLKEMLEFSMNELGIDHLSTITGIDLKTSYEVMYHLFGSGVALSIAVQIDHTDPHIGTVTDIIPGAGLYERELQDFFGIKVDNIPDGRRLILPDVWPEGQYPLRKDWNKSMLPRSMMEGLRREWNE